MRHAFAAVLVNFRCQTVVATTTEAVGRRCLVVVVVAHRCHTSLGVQKFVFDGLRRTAGAAGAAVVAAMSRLPASVKHIVVQVILFEVILELININ